MTLALQSLCGTRPWNAYWSACLSRCHVSNMKRVRSSMEQTKFSHSEYRPQTSYCGRTYQILTTVLPWLPFLTSPWPVWPLTWANNLNLIGNKSKTCMAKSMKSKVNMQPQRQFQIKPPNNSNANHEKYWITCFSFSLGEIKMQSRCYYFSDNLTFSNYQSQKPWQLYRCVYQSHS